MIPREVSHVTVQGQGTRAQPVEMVSTETDNEKLQNINVTRFRP